MLALRCPAKYYDWGKLGSNSLVAQLLKAKGYVEVDESKPYAELWMSNHPSDPSILVNPDPTLGEHPLGQLFELWPVVLGSETYRRVFGKNIPYMAKVLSIAKPLSIQTHPDKELAERLHQESPDKYPDANHKPEMVIALGEFHALCYFRPHNQIRQFLAEFEELRNLIGEDLVHEYLHSNESDQKACLKNCFTALMNADQEAVKTYLSSLVEKLKASEPDHILLFINQHHPNDVGCFCYFFLNYFQVESGQAFFIDVNEPHCYLKGDCLECMVSSDNVIRAGLTSKFKDVSLLCESLSYEPKELQEFMIKAERVNRIIKRYSCPAKEFEVEVIEINEQQFPKHKDDVDSKGVGQMCLVLEGESEFHNLAVLKAGDVYFIPSRVTLTFTHIKSTLKLVRFYVPKYELPVV